MLAVSDALSRKNVSEISRLYEIRYETLRNWLKLYRETGSLAPRRGKTLEPDGVLLHPLKLPKHLNVRFVRVPLNNGKYEVLGWSNTPK